MKPKGSVLWADVTESQWNNWRWQLKNRITSVEQLKSVINLSAGEARKIHECQKIFSMAITPHYACLMNISGRDCPIRRQVVPDSSEIIHSPNDMEDPLHEVSGSIAPGLTHRYPDRVLLLVTDRCAAYCRHCTRRRLTGNREKTISRVDLEAALEYIRSNSKIRDVLISGGDPLTLPDNELEFILKSLREIKHVEIVRIGTRVPVVLPQRITRKLCKMLRKYHPLWINTHYNHPAELVPESMEACHRLADAGIPLGNQSVLLKGINDCPHVMKKLVQDLVKNRVRPYYIYQCDLSQGISHFRTAVSKGIEIYENLRGHTSGLAVPTFVVDAPGGGGKIPVFPNYVVSQSDRKIVMRNFEGKLYSYTEPEDNRSICKCEVCSSKEPEQFGVAGLLQTKIGD